MKMRYKNYIRCAVAVLLGSALASCSDDELNSSELKVYVNTGLQNHVEVMLTQTPIGAIGQSTIEFPVRSTRELLVDAQVNCIIEDALAETYNEAKNTNHKLLTPDQYTLAVGQSIIRQGEQISEEAIRVELTNPSTLTAEEGYILPIRLDAAHSADKGLEVSRNMNTVYITINSFATNIKAEQVAPTETLIDKAGWTATATTHYRTHVPAYMVDGNAATCWFGMRTPDLTFDMGASYTIRGLRLTPDYVNFHNVYNLNDLEILTSSDGNNWESQGELLFASPSGGSVTDPQYRYIHLYAPVTVRYFRIHVTAAPYSYTSLAEVDAYK